MGNSALFNGQSGTAATGTNGISTAQTAATFGDKLLKNVTNNVAGAAIDSAINGKPLDEKVLSTALTSALITTGLASGANAIGDARVDGNPTTGNANTLNDFTSKIAHAVLGCAGGAATGGGCAAGAVGAVIGEMTAEYAKDAKLSDSQALALAKTLAASIGVLVGGGGDNVGAVNLAATAGANAAENNYLKHADRLALNKSQSACYATGDSTACSTAIALQRKDELSDKLLSNAAASCKGIECNDVTNFIQTQMNSLGCTAPSACSDYNTLNRYLRVAQEKAQGLEPVYPEGWVLDAKAALDLGKFGVKLLTGAAGTKSSLDALGQLARTDAVAATSQFYRDGAIVELGTSKVITNPNEAVFWSGRTDGVGGIDAAQNIANKFKGQTLEQLIESRQISMPSYDPNIPSTVQAWKDISSELAKNARGEVRAVLGSQMRPQSIWETYELPALLNNPSVTKITAIDPKTGIEKIIFDRNKK